MAAQGTTIAAMHNNAFAGIYQTSNRITWQGTATMRQFDHNQRCLALVTALCQTLFTALNTLAVPFQITTTLQDRGQMIDKRYHWKFRAA